MNNTINILKITILSLIVVILMGVLVIFIKDGKSFKFNFKQEKSKLIYDNVITEEFNKIDIDASSIDIKLEKSTDDKVNVKVYDTDNDNLTVNVDNGTLKIVNKKDRSCFIFCFIRKREIIISLPEKEYDLVVNSKSSDIDSFVNLNDVNLKVTSGDINLMNVGNAKINVTSGDVKIDNIISVDLETRSGDITLNTVSSYLKIKTTSGDVKINNLNIIKDSEIKVTSGDVKIDNVLSSVYFNTKVTSGDVKINNNDRHADCELNIKTTSGDIKVNN